MTIFDQYKDLQPFKRIHYTQQRHGKGLNVVVYKRNGSFNLSECAYIALGYPNFVVLYHSEASRVCIIKRAVQSDACALKVYQRERTTKHYIHARQFCHMIGLSLEKRHTYEATLQDNALVIRLDQEIMQANKL